MRGLDSTGQPGISSFFTAFNRSKKSVAIDLKTNRGQMLTRDLAKHCDVLVENFRPGVMAKFGLTESILRAENPALIYVSISAYGASGSMSDRPGNRLVGTNGCRSVSRSATRLMLSNNRFA